MVKKILFLLLFTTLYSNLYSQSITNNGFVREGNNLVVSYQLKGLRNDQTCFIELFVSIDGGVTFSKPLKFLWGDAGEISGNGIKKIKWNVYEEFEKFEGGNIVFDIRAKITNKVLPTATFISYTFSPYAPYGLMVGRVSRWGYYAKAATNGSFTSNKYSYTNGTITDYTGAGYYEFDGTKKYSTYSFTIGGLKRVTDNFYLYAGAGYGSRTLLWKMNEFSYVTFDKTSDAWVKYSDNSYQGIALELGGIIRYKKFIFSLGASSINAKSFDLAVGIGVAFN